MFAIVEIAGQQFKVEKDQQLFVHRQDAKEGDKVDYHEVLLLNDGGNVTVGAPAVDGAKVSAKVVRHLKGDKVIVFKKKRRKGYKVKNGHRQALTELLIEGITASGAKKPAAKKAEPKKETPKKEEAPKTEAPKKAAKGADDLKKIEGVGPKAAEALVNAGLATYADVAKADPEKIKEILTEASPRLAHLVTDTWPQQAALAADGKWDELKKLQDELDGGIAK